MSRLPLALALLVSSSAFAYSPGQASSSLTATGCNGGGCHGGGAAPPGDSIAGAGTIFSEQEVSYTVFVHTPNLSADGGTGPAGFTLSASKPGLFSTVAGPTGAKVKILELFDGGSEATQSAPKLDVEDGNAAQVVVFSLKWQPRADVSGPVTLTSWNLSSNGDGSPASGDGSSKVQLNLCVRFPKSSACGANNCGTTPDGCGQQFDCGACAAPATCGGGGVANTCGCPKRTCAQLGKECGVVVDPLCGGEVTCSACPTGKKCSADNKCVCAPNTCEGLSACGDVADGCGGTLHCGECGGGRASCGGGGQGNRCGCPAGQASAELCNGVDDDCNGQVDDGCTEAPGCGCGAGPGVAGWMAAGLGALAWARRKRLRA